MRTEQEEGTQLEKEHKRVRNTTRKVLCFSRQNNLHLIPNCEQSAMSLTGWRYKFKEKFLDGSNALGHFLTTIECC